MEESANEILTAIVHGMRRDETSHTVRLAATTALFNSLEFTNANFSRDDERNYIMQVIIITYLTNYLLLSYLGQKYNFLIYLKLDTEVISEFLFTHLLLYAYKLDSDTMLDSAKAPSNLIWFALG